MMNALLQEDGLTACHANPIYEAPMPPMTSMQEAALSEEDAGSDSDDDRDNSNSDFLGSFISSRSLVPK